MSRLTIAAATVAAAIDCHQFRLRSGDRRAVGVMWSTVDISASPWREPRMCGLGEQRATSSEVKVKNVAQAYG
jgi:hypothetical protein